MPRIRDFLAMVNLRCRRISQRAIDVASTHVRVSNPVFATNHPLPLTLAATNLPLLSCRRPFPRLK